MRAPALSIVSASIMVLSLLLSGCSKGPSSEYQLAQQGLLSGDISDDGRLAIIGSIHHGGSLWDIGNNERLFSWNHKSGTYGSFRTSALAKNGKVAVTTEERNIGVWNTVSGKSRGFWQAPARILSIKLNADGSKALMGLSNGNASYFDLIQGTTIFNFEHKAEVRSVDLNESVNIALTGSDDQRAVTWDLSTGKEIASLSFNNLVKSVALSNSGALAFASSQREDAIVWDPLSGATKASVASRYTNYTNATFSDDDQQLYLGTFQGTIEQWELSSQTKQNTWQAKPRKAYGGSNSKAIVSIRIFVDTIKALTSDGQLQLFGR